MFDSPISKGTPPMRGPDSADRCHSVSHLMVIDHVTGIESPHAVADNMHLFPFCEIIGNCFNAFFLGPLGRLRVHLGEIKATSSGRGYFIFTTT